MTRTHIPLVRPERKKKPISRLQRGGRIKPVSATKAKLQKIYSALRKSFLEARPICEWWLKENGWRQDTNCGDTPTYSGREEARAVWAWLVWKYSAPFSEDIHHKKGRGKYYLDTSTWMAVSRQAHEKIHADPKTSFEKGYMLPRN